MPAESEHSQWNLVGSADFYLGWLLNETDLEYSQEELTALKPEDVTNLIVERAKEMYNDREAEYGEEVTREMERVVMLKCVDTQWMDHIDAMDQLQKGIRLRAYAQRDPVVEYRLEGFDMFDQTIDNIRDDVTRFILSARIQKVTSAEEFNKMINQEANQQARKLGMKKPIQRRPPVETPEQASFDPGR